MKHDPKIVLPLRDISARVAAEMDALEHRVERLENALDAVLRSSDAEIDNEAMSMLQEVDMVRQSIAALAAFLNTLSRTTDNVGLVNINTPLEHVTLRDLAARLSGEPSRTVTTGEAELF